VAHADELSNLDATALAELVCKKEVKPVELVQSAIDRIEKVNPRINAVVNAAPAFYGEMLWKQFLTVWAAGVTWTIKNMNFALGRMPAEGELEPITLAYDRVGQEVRAADYLIAVQYSQLLARQVAEFMKRYDVLLTPTLGSPPLPLGSFVPTPEDPLVNGIASTFVPFTPISNTMGQPAMSVPLFWNAEVHPERGRSHHFP
jgi:amidase